MMPERRRNVVKQLIKLISLSFVSKKIIKLNNLKIACKISLQITTKLNNILNTTNILINYNYMGKFILCNFNVATRLIAYVFSFCCSLLFIFRFYIAGNFFKWIRFTQLHLLWKLWYDGIKTSLFNKFIIRFFCVKEVYFQKYLKFQWNDL